MRDLLHAHEQWPALERLLDDALDQPAAQRQAWLDALGTEHAAHKDTLRQLLQAHAKAESADLYGSLPRLAVPAASTQPGPLAGDSVGPYQLLRELGHGGMGTVWLAQRSDGQLKRAVALKLPRLSWVPDLAQRMARERDILATLQHPHIARLYDAGLDAQGRPYLAIEYVQGLAIDAYVQQRALDVAARLALLLQVADAVAYAHSRLVIHRDLKPSNILVNDEGQVRLLDFGIAKLMDADSHSPAHEAALTQSTARALTPDYASPEQLRGQAMGTASDVYSLGVVAFELLTGQRPYRFKAGLGALAMAAAADRIGQPLASRSTTDTTLQRRLRGDLDAILACAMASAPHERYATVRAMADDVQRHLRGEPVLARAPSLLYVAQRWVRRHKLETAIAAALLLAAAGGAYAQVLVVLALGAGTLVALWQRNQARQHAAVAQAATARAEQVKDFIASIFTQAVPRAGSGGAVLAVDLLRAAAQRVESDLAAQPAVAAVAAELGALIGASFNELSETKAGLEWLPKAVAMCTRELGPTHPLTLQTRWRLAEAANTQGELAISEPLLPLLLRDLRAAQPAQQALLLSALSSQAFVDTKCGRRDQAFANLHEAVDMAQQHFGAASHRALLAQYSLSNTGIHFREYEIALKAITPAFAQAQASLGAQRPHLVLSLVERGMADAMAANHRPREATALLRRVLLDQRALDGEETPRVRSVMTTLGASLMAGGHFDEAAQVFAQAAAIHTRLTGGINHEGASLQKWLGRVCVLQGDGPGALVHMAQLAALEAGLADQGELHRHNSAVLHVEAKVAAGLNEQALAHAQALLNAPSPPASLLAVRLHLARTTALRHLGRWSEALAHAQLTLQACAACDCPELLHGLVLAETARCHACAGHAEPAAQCWREALAVWQAGQVDGAELLASAPQAQPSLL